MNQLKAYTLIEILIALSVFAILATITSVAMYQAFNTRDQINQQANRLNQLQIALTLIEKDTQQIVDRSILGDEMRTFPALIGQNRYLEFTRGGIVNPHAQEQRSTLQRVAWICQNKKLIRRSWERLDSTNRKAYHDKVVLVGLEQCQFAYLSHSRQILKEWRENAVQQNQNPEPIPIAVQLTLMTPHEGEMSLLFVLPESLYG